MSANQAKETVLCKVFIMGAALSADVVAHLRICLFYHNYPSITRLKQAWTALYASCYKVNINSISLITIAILFDLVSDTRLLKEVGDLVSHE